MESIESALRWERNRFIEEEHMLQRIKFLMVVVIGFFILSIGLSAPAQAQDKVIELKYASLYMPTHPYSVADLHWIEKIEKESKGRVKIKPYWAGTLVSARETTREIAKGVADIGFITPIYEKSGVDLTKTILGAFRGVPDERINIRVWWEIFNKFPELQKEFESVKVLAVNVASPMFLMSTKPVRSLADFKGLRIKTSADMIAPLKEFGAEGVASPMGEAYEGLQKGILNAVISPYAGYTSLKFSEIIKYEVPNFIVPRGAYASRAMNLDSWKKLPPDIQKIFEANREWWSAEILKESDKEDEAGKEAGKKAKIQVIQLPAADVQKFDAAYEADQLKNAQDVDKKGLSGTKIYNETRRLVKLYSGTK